MNICIFGLGYVGCVLAGCLAKGGHNIIGVDKNDKKVESINNGKPTIFENKIDKIISDQHKIGRISATNNGVDAVKKSDVTIICVGTPSTLQGHLNLKAVFNVARDIGKGLIKNKTFHPVFIRSTVTPGTNDEVSKLIEKFSGKSRDADFVVISNPEFLREGSAVNDFFHPPYTLLGSNDERAIKVAETIYQNVDAPIIVTDIKIAELMKFINNAFHALKIVFANEIGNICKELDINSQKVMDVFCKDKKLNVSSKYLKPGFAYGGSCLPKDLKALQMLAHENYISCPVILSINQSNEYQKELVFKKIISFKKKHIGFVGLSFKPGTDDLRNSAIIDIIEKILGKGFKIRIYDNSVNIARLEGANREYIQNKIPYISRFLSDSLDELINFSELIVIVNDPGDNRYIFNNINKDKIIYDLCNIKLENMDINYEGISW